MPCLLTPSSCPSFPSFLSSKPFVLLLFLPFFRPFPFFFTFLFKKSFKKFCRCPKSSYLCTRFPQGELMKFFDRLRTHQSYSRLLDSFRGSLEPSRFLYNWIYTDMRQSRIAWPDRHSAPPYWRGLIHDTIHYSEEFDPGSG